MAKFLEILLTKACNQKCYYCNVYCNTMYHADSPIEIDIDFLDYAIQCHDYDIYLEFSGGEPGLVKNLDDAYKCVFNHKHVKKLRIMSNGMLRIAGYDWLDDIDYYEHLVYDIDGKTIIKFYDNLDISSKYYNVIITTPKTTRSLLDNYDYFNKEYDIFNKSKYWIKILNPKTISAYDNRNDIIELFTKIGRLDEIRNFLELDDRMRKVCSKFPYLPAIDMETKKYLHCGAYSIICDRKDLTKDAVIKNNKGLLFGYNDYCKNCYIYNRMPIELISDKCIEGYVDVLSDHKKLQL